MPMRSCEPEDYSNLHTLVFTQELIGEIEHLVINSRNLKKEY